MLRGREVMSQRDQRALLDRQIEMHSSKQSKAEEHNELPTAA
jgi:hypothetical protein